MEPTTETVRLYHYLEGRWALDDIKRRRLKLSMIDDMNDPYEGRGVGSTLDASQGALEQTVNTFIEKYSVQCFSRSWNNILMWSYYAEKHKGMCLGFDVHKDVAREIEYVSELLVVGDLIAEKPSDFDAKRAQRIVDRIVWSKYEAWAYEQEVRVHHGRDEVDEETKVHFRQFNQKLILKEVIAGARFPFSKKLIEDALVGYSGQEDVKTVKLRCSNTAFELVVDESW